MIGFESISNRSIETLRQHNSSSNVPIRIHKSASSSVINGSRHREELVFHQNIHKSNNHIKQHFNNTSYCFTYYIVILLGVALGSWIGGLFELLYLSYNGCFNEYRGHLKCNSRYASSNVTVQCLNTFYQKSDRNIFPYICLCRLRDNLTAKYRDCDFLHVKIQ